MVFGRRRAFLENIVYKYLFRVFDGDGLRKYLVVKVLETLYPEETSMIKKRICPWCGKKFICGHLPTHLSGYTNKCSSAFKAMVDDVIETYMKLAGKIVRCGWRKGKFRIDFGNESKYFNTVREAISYCLENGVLQ